MIHEKPQQSQLLKDMVLNLCHQVIGKLDFTERIWVIQQLIKWLSTEEKEFQMSTAGTLGDSDEENNVNTKSKNGSIVNKINQILEVYLIKKKDFDNGIDAPIECVKKKKGKERFKKVQKKATDVL